MCGHEIVPEAKSAEKRLSALMDKELGVYIESDALAEFLVNNWALVAAYAHAIHRREAPIRDAQSRVQALSQEEIAAYNNRIDSGGVARPVSMVQHDPETGAPINCP